MSEIRPSLLAYTNAGKRWMAALRGEAAERDYRFAGFDDELMTLEDLGDGLSQYPNAVALVILPGGIPSPEMIEHKPFTGRQIIETAGKLAIPRFVVCTNKNLTTIFPGDEPDRLVHSSSVGRMRKELFDWLASLPVNNS